MRLVHGRSRKTCNVFLVKFAKEQSWVQDGRISKVESIKVISKGLAHWREAAGDLKTRHS